VLNKIIRKNNRLLAGFYKAGCSYRSLNYPVISFTFDDCMHNAIETGASILNYYDVKGTFYVSGALTNKYENNLKCHTYNDVVSLVNDSHEIASHLFNHRKCEELTLSELKDEVKKSKEYIFDLYGQSKELNFSYPFGSVDLKTKKYLYSEFTSARNIVTGVNKKKFDRLSLNAFPLYLSKCTEKQILRAIKEASINDYWLIFYTHDVSKNPSQYGITPDLLKFAVRSSMENNCKIQTIEQVLTNCELG